MFISLMDYSEAHSFSGFPFVERVIKPPLLQQVKNSVADVTIERMAVA